VTALMQSIADGTFGTKPPPPIYPDNWPDVAYALNNKHPERDSTDDCAWNKAEER
jgi:hypothetical protein